MPTLRKLAQNNLSTLQKFLHSHFDSSMLMLSNLQQAGIVYNGDRYSADYYGIFIDSQLTGVIAHTGHGYCLVQCPEQLLDELVPYALKQTDRAMAGILGPAAQASRTTEMLLTERDSIQMDSLENLYSLELDNMRLPRELTGGNLVGRPMEQEDMEVLAQFTLDYKVQSLREKDTPELRERIVTRLAASLHEESTWILLDDDLPVSCCSISAKTHDAVQLGAVWTPPAARSRGYARSVVAACLYQAWRSGKSKAVLFTAASNTPAIRAYTALGFGLIGDYRITLFKNPIRFKV